VQEGPGTTSALGRGELEYKGINKQVHSLLAGHFQRPARSTFWLLSLCRSLFPRGGPAVKNEDWATSHYPFQTDVLRHLGTPAAFIKPRTWGG